MYSQTPVGQLFLHYSVLLVQVNECLPPLFKYPVFIFEEWKDQTFNPFASRQAEQSQELFYVPVLTQIKPFLNMGGTWPYFFQTGERNIKQGFLEWQ